MVLTFSSVWIISGMIALISVGANGLDDLRLRIESSTFEPCAQFRNGRLISNTSRIDISQGPYNVAKYGLSRLSRLRVVDQRGSVKDLTLPGCFNIRVEATFTQSIENPYVEAFIKNDREELCRKLKDNPYCPRTDNDNVRAMTQDQVTCRFCDFCIAADELADKLRSANSGFSMTTTSSSCTGNRRIQAGQPYPFELSNICTPTSSELDRQMTQKFGPSWRDVDFIRRGTLIMTVHFMNRRNLAPVSCLQLGAGTYQWNGSPALNDAVRANLETTCNRYRNPASEADKPQDEYLGCYNGYINYAIDRLQQ